MTFAYWYTRVVKNPLFLQQIARLCLVTIIANAKEREMCSGNGSNKSEMGLGK